MTAAEQNARKKRRVSQCTRRASTVIYSNKTYQVARETNPGWLQILIGSLLSCH